MPIVYTLTNTHRMNTNCAKCWDYAECDNKYWYCSSCAWLLLDSILAMKPMATTKGGDMQALSKELSDRFMEWRVEHLPDWSTKQLTLERMKEIVDGSELAFPKVDWVELTPWDRITYTDNPIPWGIYKVTKKEDNDSSVDMENIYDDLVYGDCFYVDYWQLAWNEEKIKATLSKYWYSPLVALLPLNDDIIEELSMKIAERHYWPRVTLWSKQEFIKELLRKVGTKQVDINKVSKEIWYTWYYPSKEEQINTVKKILTKYFIW